MWKRNVAIGLASVLSIITVALCITNVNQQSRLNALEQVRDETSSQIETEIQRYLSDNAISLVNAAAEDNGISTEDLVQSAIDSVISTSEDGTYLYLDLTDDQKAEIASKISDIAYKKLSDQVLTGDASIDTAQMEAEIASAVTNVLTEYIDGMEKEYVTASVNTNEIVNQVISKLNLTTTSSPAMTESEIRELVKSLVGNSSVTSESASSYQDTITDEVINYIISNDMVSNGKTGADGANGLDGEDGKTPEYGVDYMTPEDIEELRTDIENTLASTEGLRVYGVQGTGITAATINESGDLDLTLSSDPLLGEEDKIVSVDNVDGNSLKYMDVEETAPGTGHFNVNYYTEYPLKTGDTPLYYCSSCEEDNKIKTSDTCESGHDGLQRVYKYVAGEVSITESQIAQLIASAEKTIISSINDQLGGTNGSSSLQDMQNTINELQKSIEELTVYVNGGDSITKTIYRDAAGNILDGENGNILYYWDSAKHVYYEIVEREQRNYMYFVDDDNNLLNASKDSLVATYSTKNNNYYTGTISRTVIYNIDESKNLLDPTSGKISYFWDASKEGYYSTQKTEQHNTIYNADTNGVITNDGKYEYTIDPNGNIVGQLQETAYAGLNKLTDESTTTDSNGNDSYQYGSLAWITDQLTKNKADIDSLKDTQSDINAEESQYASVSEPMEITVGGANWVVDGDYYTATVSCDGITNKRPEAALFGVNGGNPDATKVPDKTASTIWSYCKYFQVDTDAETVTFYFYKASDAVEADADIEKLFDGESIYVGLTGYKLDNEGTAVNTNQTLANYGSIRVEGVQTTPDGSKQVNLTGPYILGGSNAQFNITTSN